MFLESILFLQKLKISKTVLPCSSDLVAGHTSRMPQSWARGSVLATYLRVEGPVARGTQRCSRLSLRLSRKWDFQSWKSLSKFFQNFWLEVFWRVKLATYRSRENRVVCKKKLFFDTILQKGLNFFLHPVNVHFLASLSLFQHHRGQLQNLQLFCHHFLNLQRKVWVLSSTLYFSQLLPFPHGFCALYNIYISLDCIWVSDCLVSSLCVFWWLYTDLLYIVTTLGH